MKISDIRIGMPVTLDVPLPPGQKPEDGVVDAIDTDENIARIKTDGRGPWWAMVEYLKAKEK